MKAFIAKILSLSLPAKIGIGFATVAVIGGIITVPIVMSNQNPTEEEVLAQVEEYVEATAEPTKELTPEPTVEPTAEPKEEPTPEATAEPTEEPTIEATVEPTEEPTTEAIVEPTAPPTDIEVESVENTNEVIDVSGYSPFDYVPGPYNLSVDANGIPDGATVDNFGGDEDKYQEWSYSWSLKKVWTAPNGKMVKICNHLNMNDEVFQQKIKNGGNKNDVYGAMDSSEESSKAIDYWYFGENIDVQTGVGQSQNLPAVPKASSWCMDGSDVDSRFGSDVMKEYHKILARILFKMRNPNEEPNGNEIGTYGVMYDPTHVSMVAFMSKAFEFRFYGDYINIQIYKDLNEVDKQVFHDYLNLLTPIGDTIYSDIMTGLDYGLAEVPTMDAWYPINGYNIWVSNTYGEEYIEIKIKN